MGMYDYFDKLICPKCKRMLEYPQTKDGPKSLRHLFPGAVFKQPPERDEYYNTSDVMVAYGSCPECKIMWDVKMPLLKVTGMVVVSPDTQKYEYIKATWAKQPDL